MKTRIDFPAFLNDGAAFPFSKYSALAPLSKTPLQAFASGRTNDRRSENSISSMTKAGNTITAADKAAKHANDSNTSDSWVVKLHPDSGVNFYENAESKILLWTDPYCNDANEATTDEASDQVTCNEANESEREKLAGFSLVPPFVSLCSEEFADSFDR